MPLRLYVGYEMTDNKTRALKLALEWDKRRKYIMPYVVRDAIREALAEQPAQQQEPVAYMNPDDLEKMKRFGRGSVAWATPTYLCTQPVYTTPQPSKPLTDEEIKRMAAPWFLSMYWPICNTFAREIEAAHGIKGDA